MNACKIAVGMGANVTILDVNLKRLEELDNLFGAHIQTLVSTDSNIERVLKDADLVIGSVLIPGGSTPKLFKKKYLKEMKDGAVFVDVAIDQGGCGESSHVTTHDDPVYTVDGVVHYCVGNMPGAVPRTSTIALTNATLKYGLQIARAGLEEAAKTEYNIPEHVELFPPCAIFLAAGDELVNPENSKLLAEALKARDIPCRLEIGPTGGHGFADGAGMCMAGWTERAIRWYESL